MKTQLVNSSEDPIEYTLAGQGPVLAPRVISSGSILITSESVDGRLPFKTKGFSQSIDWLYRHKP